uniref:Small ribosomal subunit protein uS19c n=1 Tax=Cyanophora biloba TaxID=1489483 RepID=A0A873WRN7_9EUKA|nr:ribosomal protein S19 [Cyanophora biloba]QPB15033.1 ribosomal protein S19 [Cyanophora biloba]
MTRSNWKGIYLKPNLSKKFLINKNTPEKKLIGKEWSRNSVIVKNLVNLKLNLYNGKKFTPVLISDQMIGHKLGEFCLTKLPCAHKKKNNKNKKWVKK